MNEITKLAVAKGGNPLTMNGLAGMGDLVLTCTGKQVGANAASGFNTGWHALYHAAEEVPQSTGGCE